MLIKEILETEYEKLSETAQPLYNKTDDGYILKDEYYTDNSGLVSTLDKLKVDKIDGQTTIQEMQSKYEALELKYAKRNGDKKEIDRLNQEQLDKQALSHNDALAKAQNTIHELTIGSTRDSIANEIFLNANAWRMTDMESRIKVGDDNKTYLTNKLGETVTREAFIEEMKADTSLAFALKGSSGNGGANITETTNGPTPKNDKGFVEMSTAEKVARLKSKMSA